MSPAAAAEAVVERVIADHPEIGGLRLGPGRWTAALVGEVRHLIPVTIDVGQRTCSVSSFLMRGPRSGNGPLFELLLRKNLVTRHLRFCLDGDGDVLLVGRLAAAGMTVEDLEELLGEVQSLSESAFEGLVHIGYPGVFPPLRRTFLPDPSA